MDAVKDKYFKQNATGVALVEFFWGLGFPVIMESTFLQIFLKTLGASDFLIGLVPSIFILGISIFPLLSSYLIRNREEKKSIVLNLHIVSSCSTLFFGLFLFGARDSAIILPVFFTSYLNFSMCIGVTFPIWLDFLVKIFSENKNVQGLSIMFATQNFAKIIASFFIINVVETYSLSLYSAAWIFLGSGLFFLVGSFCFLFTKEIENNVKPEKNHDSFLRHTQNTIREMVRNKNLMKFLVSDLDNYIVLTTIAFYANYATQFFQIKTAVAAGLFVTFIYSGAILANVSLGTLNLLSLKNKFLSTKVLTVIMLLILVFYPTLKGFLVASILLGFCRGTRGIVFSPAVKKFAQKDDITGYFAVAPLLTMAFGAGFPLIFGKVLDHYSNLGSTAYKMMFSVSIGIVIMTLVVGILTDFKGDIKNTP